MAGSVTLQCSFQTRNERQVWADVDPMIAFAKDAKQARRTALSSLEHEILANLLGIDVGKHLSHDPQKDLQICR